MELMSNLVHDLGLFAAGVLFAIFLFTEYQNRDVETWLDDGQAVEAKKEADWR